MKARFGNSFGRALAKRIESYQFEVGILDDKPHRLAEEHGLFEEPKLTKYAGDTIAKTSRKASDHSIGDVLVANMERMNINLLLKPFQEKSSELMKFTEGYLREVTKKGQNMRRVENLLQAVVRNPILRQEYGKNKASTADAKGFDRLLFHTGQMFKAIKVKAKRV